MNDKINIRKGVMYLLNNFFNQNVQFTDGHVYNISVKFKETDYLKLGIIQYEFQEHSDGLTSYIVNGLLVSSDDPNNDSIDKSDLENEKKLVMDINFEIFFETDELLNDEQTVGEIHLISKRILSNFTLESVKKSEEISIDDLSVTAELEFIE